MPIRRRKPIVWTIPPPRFRHTEIFLEGKIVWFGDQDFAIQTKTGRQKRFTVFKTGDFGISEGCVHKFHRLIVIQYKTLQHLVGVEHKHAE